MNRKLVAAAAVILFIVIALAAIAGTFLATAPTYEITYKEPASAVHASLGKTATSNTIALRLNSITDGSNPATSAAWANLYQNKTGGWLFNVSLTPRTPNDRYLVANITVTNAQPTQVPFSYGAFVLLTPNNIGVLCQLRRMQPQLRCASPPKPDAERGLFERSLRALFRAGRDRRAKSRVHDIQSGNRDVSDLKFTITI